MNVALYGAGRHRWAFTEHARKSVRCEADSLTVGRSQVSWNGTCLTCRIDEIAVPLPFRIRGTIRLYPEGVTRFALALGEHGLHWWQPIIPRGRVEVDMEQPALSWRGTGYLDTNDGATPLDEGFRSWTRLRAHTSTGATVIYDVVPTSGLQIVHALRFTPSGNVQQFTAPPRIALSSTGWRIDRETRADVGSTPVVVETLEDAPFYARTLLDMQLSGERVTAIHESLSLDRFRSGWVRTLLPIRMRRSRR
jgi:carotenoid 1,2-hydratase